MFGVITIAVSILLGLLYFLINISYKSRNRQVYMLAEKERQKSLSKKIILNKGDMKVSVSLRDIAWYAYSVEIPSKWEMLTDSPTTISCMNWDRDKLYTKLSDICGEDYDTKRLYQDIVTQHPEAVKEIDLVKYTN